MTSKRYLLSYGLLVLLCSCARGCAHAHCGICSLLRGSVAPFLTQQYTVAQTCDTLTLIRL